MIKVSLLKWGKYEKKIKIMLKKEKENGIYVI